MLITLSRRTAICQLVAEVQFERCGSLGSCKPQIIIIKYAACQQVHGIVKINLCIFSLRSVISTSLSLQFTPLAHNIFGFCFFFFFFFFFFFLLLLLLFLSLPSYVLHTHHEEGVATRTIYRKNGRKKKTDQNYAGRMERHTKAFGLRNWWITAHNSGKWRSSLEQAAQRSYKAIQG